MSDECYADSNSPEPAPYVLEWEDIDAFHARYPHGAPLLYDSKPFWKYTDFTTEAEARAFVEAKRETISIGSASLFRRDSISDDGFSESWGDWVSRWRWIEEFVTSDL